MVILFEPFYLTYLIMGIPIPIVLLGFVAMATDITRVLIPVQYDNINHFAHLGGYLAVVPILFLLKKQVRAKMKRNAVINFALFLVFIVLRFYGVI